MRSITHLALAALTAASLTAAGQGGAVPAKPDDKTILHVLNRTAFGARPGDIERVRQQGLRAYLDRQLHPENIEDPDLQTRLAGLDTLRMSSRELAQAYFEPAVAARRQNADEGTMGEAPPVRTPAQMAAGRKAREVILELSAQKVLRAAFSERQL